MTPREPAIRLLLASVVLGLLIGSAGAAQRRAAPAACDATQRPSAIPTGPLPQVHVWKKSGLPAGWRPPACLPWPSASDAAVVETLGTFASGSDGAALLARLGHVSRLAGLKCWSAADQEWRPLFTQAVALSRPDPDAKRADFAPSELHQGGTYYLLQSDGNPLGPIVQAMTILEATPTRLVANMRNVSDLSFLGMPLVSEDRAPDLLRPGAEPRRDLVLLLARQARDAPAWLPRAVRGDAREQGGRDLPLRRRLSGRHRAADRPQRAPLEEIRRLAVAPNEGRKIAGLVRRAGTDAPDGRRPCGVVPAAAHHVHVHLRHEVADRRHVDLVGRGDALHQPRRAQDLGRQQVVVGRSRGP